MRFKALLLATALAAAALAAPASATQLFTNGSFEENFDGWTVSDDQLITATHETDHFAAPGYAGHDATYLPIDGFVHAQLAPNAQDVITLLSQTFDVLTASRLTGMVAFLGEDYIDPAGALYPDRPGAFDDYGFVRIFAADADVHAFSTPLFSASIGALGNFGFTPWTAVDARLGPGRYTLEFGIANVGDGFDDSRLVADAFQVTAGVPEPMTWALMLTGFFTIGAALRRRRPQPVRIRVRRD